MKEKVGGLMRDLALKLSKWFGKSLEFNKYNYKLPRICDTGSEV